METNKNIFWLTLLLITGWLIYLLSPVLMPFLIGATLAYMGDPLVDRLESLKLPRTFAVVIVFMVTLLLLIGFFVVIIPAISNQVENSIEKIPVAIHWLNETAIPWLNQHLNLNISDATADIQNWLKGHWQDTGAIVTSVLSSISSSSLALIAWVGNFLLIPVVAFYLLRDWDILVKYIGDLIPRKQSKVVFGLAQDANDVLGAFVRGQLLVMLALAIIYSLGLWIAGLQVALLIGLIAGVASIVPYLGFAVGIIAAIVAALIEYHTFGSVVSVVIVFAIGQALEGMVLTPLLVGDKIGLHPVTVIFAVLAGGQLFGFVGVLIALPVAAVLAVIIRHLHKNYRSSHYYENDPEAKTILTDENG